MDLVLLEFVGVEGDIADQDVPEEVPYLFGGLPLQDDVEVPEVAIAIPNC